jgi:signal peptide peptidase SppA
LRRRIASPWNSATASAGSDAERKPFIYSDGLAIIPIHGALLNRFGGSWGFVTGYNAIRRQMNAALEDDDVKLLVFDVDSPGGETAGCFELAEEMRASREIKPSIAVVDALSASAGYALASAATRMVATPSSKIGSIGVYIMHVDFSGSLDQAGIQITYIEAPKGGMKTAGSAYRKLDKRAAEYLQAFVDASYEDFVAMVAENRGLDDAAIRETEARVFRADEALALGLIDEVKTPSEAVSTFVAELADDEPSEEEDEEMTTGRLPPLPPLPLRPPLRKLLPRLTPLRSRPPLPPTASAWRDQGAARGGQAAEARRHAGARRLHRRRGDRRAEGGCRRSSDRACRRSAEARRDGRRAEGGRDEPSRNGNGRHEAAGSRRWRGRRRRPGRREVRRRVSQSILADHARQLAGATSRRSNFQQKAPAGRLEQGV